MSTPRLPTTPLLAALASWLALAACQFSDIAAFKNNTAAPLTLRAEVEGEFARYDCEGSGGDLVRFEGQTEIAIPPGQAICLEGPATDFGDSYDVRDMLVLVELSRADTVCVALDGDALFDSFVPDGRFKTLFVDEERCPTDENAADAEVATEGEDGG